MKAYDKKMLVSAGAILAAALVLSGCGCGKKNTDPETQEVLKISITPEPTPTETPQETNPDAVATNGNLTMVNGYLANGESAVESTAVSPDGSQTEEGATSSDAGESSGSSDSSAGDE